VENARGKFSTRDDVTFFGGTRAIAGYHPDGLLLRMGNLLQTVRFDSMIWAAGALDTLGLFPGNDTPGLLGPRALYRLLVRDGLDVKGKTVLVIGSGMDFWLSAALLDTSGARLNLVVTDAGSPDEIAAAVDRKWPLNTGLELHSISGYGKQHLRASFTPNASSGNRTGSRLTMQADLAVICNRAKPAYDVPYQLGTDLALQPGLGGFVLSDSPSLVAVGEAAGGLPGVAANPAGEVEST
jgi:hypothetical protein